MTRIPPWYGITNPKRGADDGASINSKQEVAWVRGSGAEISPAHVVGNKAKFRGYIPDGRP